jgi:hypothetical protein
MTSGQGKQGKQGNACMLGFSILGNIPTVIIFVCVFLFIQSMCFAITVSCLHVLYQSMCFTLTVSCLHVLYTEDLVITFNQVFQFVYACSIILNNNTSTIF